MDGVEHEQLVGDIATSRRDWSGAAVGHIDQQLASPHMQRSPFLRHKLLELRQWYAEEGDDGPSPAN